MSLQTTLDPSIHIVDADTHLTEPWDLWTSRTSGSYAERVPQVKDVDGHPSWVFDGKVVGPAGAVSVIDKDLVKHLGAEFLFTKTVHDVAAAASQVEPRLRLMDSQGVWAHLVYPNAVGFGGQQLGTTGDLDLRRVAAQTYNDAMAEFQHRSGNRLFPMAVLPWWDRQFALEEIERIKGLGLVGVNTIADPQEYELPELGDDYWRPVFEALEDADLPLNFHIGASATQSSFFGSASWPSFGDDEKLALGSAMLYVGNARIIANFIYSGILERHPHLKVVSVESGVGWLPFFLDALDWQLMETAPERRQKLSLTPTEYFKRQIYACFWFESTLLVEHIHALGVDNCLFETDFPHPTCLYQDSMARSLDLLRGQPLDVQQKVFGGNAIRVYNLPVPAGG